MSNKTTIIIITTVTVVHRSVSDVYLLEFTGFVALILVQVGQRWSLDLDWSKQNTCGSSRLIIMGRILRPTAVLNPTFGMESWSIFTFAALVPAGSAGLR